MQRDDSGDFCVLYVEPNDGRTSLLHAIIGHSGSSQKKPVVIVLTEQARIFQRSEDFLTLKQVKTQLNLPVSFVIPSGGPMAQLVTQNGFPAYLSLDTLLMGNRTYPLSTPLAFSLDSATTGSFPSVSLASTEYDSSSHRTMPLPPLSASPSGAPGPQTKKGRASSSSMLVILAILTLASTGLGYFLVLSLAFPSATSVQASQMAMPKLPVVVGHMYFLNSEQVTEDTNQGIDDQVQIDLNNLPAPAPQKNYYAWLLSDKNQGEARSVFLGVLPVMKGSAHLLYTGDQQHTNLLAVTSRFLVTEEDASVIPIAPSPDYHVWRYYGEFLQTPLKTSSTMGGMGSDHYSMLDHLRHLLAADPMLDSMQLPGGLNAWLYRNMGKIEEWTNSMRQVWEESKNTAYVRRQAIHTLTYLDGLSYVRQDVPSTMPLTTNERLASVGILEVAGPNQDPPSYLDSIVFHLNSLLHADGSPEAQRQNAAKIIAALNNINEWLKKVRSDAQQIVKMSAAQLLQPAALTLINDMIDNTNNAYAGQPDPISGEMHKGIIWLHAAMQSLTTMDIHPFTPPNSSIQMRQDIQHGPSFLFVQKDEA